MNSFDAAVTIGLVIAVVTGFNAGLLRSAVTILAYLIAMPIAIWAMSFVSQAIGSKPDAPLLENAPILFGIFLAAGIGLAKLMRMALDETFGSEPGLGDRLAGAALGAVRVGLIATTVVVMFDTLAPSDRQPEYLTASRLRPLMSVACQRGFQSLPPDAVAYIDRLRKDRRI
jgi:membrane protein required for colicin V production